MNLYGTTQFLFAAVLAVGCFAATALLTPVAIKFLRDIGSFDIPSWRSNHTVPVVRGGGVAIVDVVIIAFVVIWLAIDGGMGEYEALWPFAFASYALAAICLFDDISPRGVDIWVRVIIQLFAIYVATEVLWFWSGGKPVFQGLLPGSLDFLVTMLLWFWFINLYNFMDGVDGITSVETAFITIGIALVCIIANLPLPIFYYAVSICFVVLGFLVHNWHPAKVFMGDIGSVMLGYVIGLLLFRIAAEGHYVAALLLPGYYLFDTGITILKRMFRGEKIWLAHSEHFYQRAVRSGLSHAAVVKRIAGLNVAILFVVVLLEISLN